MKIFHFQEKNTNISLRKFIKLKYPELSSARIERCLSSGNCLLNGCSERFGSRKLKYNDRIQWNDDLGELSSPLNIVILYEDEDLFVIDKPVNVTSSAETLKTFFSQDIFLVHRLDKWTSGILILAKNPSMQKKMEKLFFERAVRKKYLALVHGRFPKEKGVIENRIGLKKRYEGGAEYRVAEQGQLSKTYFTLWGAGEKESLLLLEPHTGRTHQLRVHCENMGHPVIGDLVYGRASGYPSRSRRMLLHSYRVAFIHPNSGKKIDLQAPVPIDFKTNIGKSFRKTGSCASLSYA